MPRQVVVVPHSHWDREWYEPYQQLRHRLVAMLDELLADMEADPGYARFLLDGQMAVVDDYLEVRPEAEAQIRALAVAGRLTMGPWYILMDEFCVSGETIVRNLQRGMDRADAFGGAMAVGYLPDMFGHVSQMPQLLAQAGLDHAVVWRGVPRAVTRTAFWWRSPDGSTVRAEYLPAGYGVGAHLPTTVGALARRLRAEEGELAPFLRDDDAILLLNGTDHQRPQAHVPGLVAELNDHDEDFEMQMASLAEYVAKASTADLESWTGEMRSSARANLLAGVLSNRTDIKAAAARAERALERSAEPLAALWLSPDAWPAATLDAAWLQVIRNSAHDSICACSSDEVGRAVEFRFSEAATLAANVTRDALAHAGESMSVTGPVVVNPSARRRGGVVEVVVQQAAPGDQVLDTAVAGEVVARGVGGDFARLMGGLRADGWLGDGWGVAVDVHAAEAGVEVLIVDDRTASVTPSLDADVVEAWAQSGAHRSAPLAVTVRRRASQRVARRVDEVAGYGWRALESCASAVPPVEVVGTTMGNGLVVVAVDPADGTFAIDGHAGLGRLVDGGDDGDTYTYSPPATDLEVDGFESVTVETLEAGPVRGRMRLCGRTTWPACAVGGRRQGTRAVEIVTDLELRAGERLVRVVTSFDNPSRDHRLRAWFPLPQRASQSVAECAFATVVRPLDAEGGPDERGLATFPSRRFVCAGGLTVTHEGLLEYELVDGGASLALTLLRATGTLSKPAPAYRPNPAGPTHALQAPQMVGPVQCRYAVSVGEDDPFTLADLAWSELQVVAGSGRGWRPPSGSDLAVSGAEVSALRRAEGLLEIRVVNPTADPVTVTVAGRAGTLVDLRGVPGERWSESFPLRPWGIATARLDP